MCVVDVWLMEAQLALSAGSLALRRRVVGDERLARLVAAVALRRGKRDAALRPWLFRIAHNESVSLLRRGRWVDELPQGLESSALSVEDAVEQRARLASLLADLRDLPERQRGALVMRELSGLTHEEVALALGMSVGAAKQTVFEARRSLMEFSEGRAMVCEEIRRIVSNADRRALRGRRVRAHLRCCSGCAAFAAAIPARSDDLRALAPALPAMAASRVFTRIAGAGSGHGGAGGMIAGATAKTLGVALSAKAIAAGVAVIALTAGGAAGLEYLAHSRRAQQAGGLASAPGPNPAPAARGDLHVVRLSWGDGHHTRPGSNASRSSAGRSVRSRTVQDSRSGSLANSTSGASAAHPQGHPPSSSALSSATAGSHLGAVSHPTPGRPTPARPSPGRPTGAGGDGRGLPVAAGKPSGGGYARSSPAGGGPSGSSGRSGAVPAPSTPTGGQTATTPGVGISGARGTAGQAGR